MSFKKKKIKKKNFAKEAFENILGKGENAGNQCFLIFPQYSVFYPSKSTFHFFSDIYFVVCKCFNLK